MKRMIILAVSALLIVGAAGPSAGSTAKFSSCRALLKVYPQGVAKDAAAARAVVRDGYAKPRVLATVYQANRVKLDLDGDGILCPVEPKASPAATAQPPQTPANFSVKAAFGGSATSVTFVWQMPQGVVPTPTFDLYLNGAFRQAMTATPVAANSCPDQLTSNAGLRTYLLGWGINPDV